MSGKARLMGSGQVRLAFNHEHRFKVVSKWDAIVKDLPDAGRGACGSGAQSISGIDESHGERRYQACSDEAS